MTEPTVSSQLLGLLVIFIGFFILMIFTAKNEKSDEQNVVIIIEETEDFREVARRNLKIVIGNPPMIPSHLQDWLHRLRMYHKFLEHASKIMTDWLRTTWKKQVIMIF